MHGTRTTRLSSTKTFLVTEACLERTEFRELGFCAQVAETETAVQTQLVELWTAVGNAESLEAHAVARRALDCLQATASAPRPSIELTRTAPGSTDEADALLAVVIHDHSMCDNALDCY